MRFLSTPSARRATAWIRRSSRRRGNFYPRPLRGGRLLENKRNRKLLEISIHALCEEGDPQLAAINEYLEAISIHALCEEGDIPAGGFGRGGTNFYPRPLRGGRRPS